MPQLKLVIFDLDGTLVDSALNFELMREDLGIGKGLPILEELEKVNDQKIKDEMYQIVHQHEMKGALESTLYPGVIDFLDYLDNNNYRKAILTRNSKESATVTLDKHNLGFEYICTREDLLYQKPHPEGLLKILHYFSLTAEHAVYVGDFMFDMQAARNAKMKSLYFGNNDEIADMATENFNDYRSVLSTVELFK